MSKTLVALLFALPFAAPVAATQYLRVVNAHATPIVAVAVAPLRRWAVTRGARCR